jgi:hypothetical protein
MSQNNHSQMGHGHGYNIKKLPCPCRQRTAHCPVGQIPHTKSGNIFSYSGSGTSAPALVPTMCMGRHAPSRIRVWSIWPSVPLRNWATLPSVALRAAQLQEPRQTHTNGWTQRTCLGTVTPITPLSIMSHFHSLPIHAHPTPEPAQAAGPICPKGQP